jgi:hypothetical protein
MEAKTSSIIVKSSELIEPNQIMVSTFVIVPVLLVALYLLKKFIYITDEKRDDK